MNFKIAFVCKNVKDKYSGGRIHALTLAYGLCDIGNKVDYYTNIKPIFDNDLSKKKYSSSFNYITNKFFNWKNLDSDYDIVFVIPHLKSRLSFVIDPKFYGFCKKLAHNSLARMVFLDFESPNWFQSIHKGIREGSYKYSDKIIKSCEAILSTTKLGKKYAIDYYSKYNKNLKFFQLYLSINIDALKNKDIDQIRSDRAIFFGRFDQAHKEPAALFKVLEVLPEGYEILIIGDKSSLSKDSLTKLRILSCKKKIAVVFKKGVSDKEKFDILIDSKLLFFSSSFEGYGLPPLEAQYCGVKAICSDLPVLRETNKYAFFTNFDDLNDLKKTTNEAIQSKIKPEQLRSSVLEIASPAVLRSNLEKVINELCPKA